VKMLSFQDQAAIDSPVYLRVSTDEQAANMNGLNAQEDACRAYAVRLGWTVTGVFTDAGVSGSVGIEHRPALLEAIAMLRKGGVLLVAKRDRIGRLEPLPMAMIQRAVERKGARIVSAAGEGTESDDPSSILMRRMVDAFSEYERLIIKARTKAALGSKRTRGEKTGGAVPYGWMLGTDKPGSKGAIKTLVPCPAEQEVLAMMKTLRAGGMTLDGIAAELTARGIQRREGGTKWDFSYVRRLLKTAA
jgi:DNA invertase Pin-like site-specific DNA recombinase